MLTSSFSYIYPWANYCSRASGQIDHRPLGGATAAASYQLIGLKSVQCKVCVIMFIVFDNLIMHTIYVLELLQFAKYLVRFEITRRY